MLVRGKYAAMKAQFAEAISTGRKRDDSGPRTTGLYDARKK